jgi:hypothetical protein
LLRAGAKRTQGGSGGLRLGRVRAEHDARAEQWQERAALLCQRAEVLLSVRRSATNGRRRSGELSGDGQKLHAAVLPVLGQTPGRPHEAAATLPTAEAPPLRGSEAVIELVQRVERLMRAGVPALAITFGSGWIAGAQLRRTGPNQVALVLHASGRALGQDSLARLRQALRSRGIELSALAVR